MALTDILKTIEQEADTKVSEIQKANGEQESALREQLEAVLAEKKRAVLKQVEFQAAKKLSQASWELSAGVQTSVLAKKQQFVNVVFDEALQQLAQLDDAQYVATLAKLLAAIPELESDAVALSAAGKEAALTKAIGQAKVALTPSKETVDSVGGFVVQTKNMTIDMTFEALLKQYRSNHEADISNSLFA